MKRQERPEQAVICTRVPERVKEALGSLALKKGVNLGEYLRWLLIEHVEAKAKD